MCARRRGRRFFPGREQENGARASGGLRTLAPLEDAPAVPGPPRPLPDMEDVEARFAHLLQPIRDLTKNWEVDVAAQLGEYLEEVSAAPGEWRGTGGRAGPRGGAAGRGLRAGRAPPPGLWCPRSGRARARAGGFPFSQLRLGVWKSVRGRRPRSLPVREPRNGVSGWRPVLVSGRSRAWRVLACLRELDRG